MAASILLLLGAGVLTAQENPQEQPAFTPGEVLAKFEDGTSGSEATARTADSEPLDLAILEPEIARLSKKTVVPLTVSQLSGGGWLVLSLDGAALTDRLVKMLGDLSPVATVERGPQPPAKFGVTVADVLVEFRPGTAEAQAVTDQVDAVPGVGVDAFLEQLESDLGSPLSTEVREPGRLAISIDVVALTLSLVDRLAALPEVEAAEANYIMQIGS